MKNPQAITERILEKLNGKGASFGEVLFSQSENSLKRVVGGGVSDPPAGKGVSVLMSCVIDGKRISSNCNSLAAIDAQIENMFVKANFLPREAEEPFVPEKPFPTVSLPAEILYDQQTAEMDDSRLIEVVERVNAIIKETGCIFDGAVAQSVSDLTIANSAGTYQTCKYTDAQLSIFGFDPEDRSVSAYRTVAGKSLSQFPVEELAANVARKLSIQRDYLARHGGKRINPFGEKPGPQRFDVIMEPSCWAGLLAIFSGMGQAWNGKFYHHGLNFFAGKLGSKVMGSNITIWDDPLHPLGIPQPFDSEGYPKQKLLLVENGVAKNVVYDTALAHKYGTVSTGHGLPASARSIGALPLHLAVDGGNSNIEEMIRDSKEPTLWITTLHYLRSTHNQDGRETGTTLHGVFLIENGEIVGPAENLRFDESVPEALSRITHIGQSLPTLSMETESTPYIVPAMRSEQFRFVSVNDRST